MSLSFFPPQTYATKVNKMNLKLTHFSVMCTSPPQKSFKGALKAAQSQFWMKFVTQPYNTAPNSVYRTQVNILVWTFCCLCIVGWADVFSSVILLKSCPRDRLVFQEVITLLAAQWYWSMMHVWLLSKVSGIFFRVPRNLLGHNRWLSTLPSRKLILNRNGTQQILHDPQALL